MNINKTIHIVLGLSLALASLGSVMAQTISHIPLYAGGGAKPNILFMIDDSGSMMSGVMKTPAAVNTWQLDGIDQSMFLTSPTPAADEFDYVLRSLASGTTYTWSGTTKQAGLAFASLCPGVNLIAFNPNVTYKPWYGLPDSSFPNVQKLPNQAAQGTISMANARYVEWQDDGDGVYEFGECGAYRSGSRTYFNTSKLKRVSDLDAAGKQNFANWYTYNRTRLFAMKAGLSPVLADLRTRAGLSTIHIHQDAGVWWGMNITDVDNISDPSKQTAKDTLISEFYSFMEMIPAQIGGTPLRRTLENAGLYFHLEKTNAVGRPESKFVPDVTVSPFLPANEGGACQANHMVLVTDGYQFEYGGQEARFNWGNVDGAEGGLYSDGLSNTLADIAMYFATTDAAPNMDGMQVVNTHAVSFGVYGNIDGFPADMSEKNWPTDTERLVGNWWDPYEYLDSLDDVVHAAFNGGGQFMTATDAESLNEQMSVLMRDLSNTYRGTATSISFDRQGVADSTMMFRTLYDMENWQGELNAYSFDAATGTIGAEMWEASARLALNNAANKRKIVTFNGTRGATFNAPANFASPNTAAGELSSAQVADLLADRPAAVASADYLQDIIEYLRGDGDGYTTNPQFRVRSRLGDIVHASPVFVGAPEGYYPDAFEAAAYSAFVTSHKTRTPVVYAGANDGMLHAFEAATGNELFAYVPQALFSAGDQQGLHWLADPAYFHLPYVDETPVVGDVFVNSQWRTYLVGGLGRGGKAVYVLDVTDPAGIASEAGIAANVVVDEFTDPHLGYTFGTPKIAKLVDGEWVAIFGNGYNNNTDGKAYLYGIYLDGAGPGGVDHFKVGPLGGGSVTGGLCENTGSDCNGLSTPTTVDLNMDGRVDRVYAGDLHGNLWAFDFTLDSNGVAITASHPGDVVPVVAHVDASTNEVPLFTACRGALVAGACSKVNRQPITVKPSIAAHQQQISGAEPNLMVFFGTGQYLAESDVLSTDIQTFYGVWDAGADDGELSPQNLTAQTLAQDANGNRTMSSVTPVTYVKNAVAPANNGNYGWKLNLVAGERVIENPSVVNDVVLFPTRIASNDLCDRAGTGFIMGVDLVSGGTPPFQVFPSKNADIGIPILSGGEVVHAQGAGRKWYAPDPDDDAAPEAFEVQTEPVRAPNRSSWTIMK